MKKKKTTSKLIKKTRKNILAVMGAISLVLTSAIGILDLVGQLIEKIKEIF